jgi:hypothetical protein
MHRNLSFFIRDDRNRSSFKNLYKKTKASGQCPNNRGRHRCRWVDNIKMDLREIGWDGMDWIDLA